MQTKEILSTSNSKHTKSHSDPEKSAANSHLVRAKGDFNPITVGGGFFPTLKTFKVLIYKAIFY